jgi:aldose sugar dehydrogenase
MRKLAPMIVALLVLALVIPPAHSLPRRAQVRTWKGNLDFPVDMAWERGTNRIFFTEKNTGKVRVLIGRRLLRRACVNLDVSNAGERGALGITLHPRFKRNRFLYVFYTNRRPLQNRVTRFTVENNRCRRPRHILRGLSVRGSSIHNAGQLQFVGRKLFVTTGDASDPSVSQNRSLRLGKILRLNPNGTIPDDNPFGNSPVWAYGFRNPFGITRKPGTRQVFVTDNGPQCDDKLFRARRRRNHGWGPNYSCGNPVGPNPVRPLINWGAQRIAPTNVVFYRGRFRAMSGSLYLGDWNTGSLRRITVNDAGSRVVRRRVAFRARRPILSVDKGPGGWLYFLTNRAIRRIVRE